MVELKINVFSYQVDSLAIKLFIFYSSKLIELIFPY